jgi:RNA polymerase-binding transcription factor
MAKSKGKKKPDKKAKKPAKQAKAAPRKAAAKPAKKAAAARRSAPARKVTARKGAAKAAGRKAVPKKKVAPKKAAGARRPASKVTGKAARSAARKPAKAAHKPAAARKAARPKAANVVKSAAHKGAPAKKSRMADRQATPGQPITAAQLVNTHLPHIDSKTLRQIVGKLGEMRQESLNIVNQHVQTDLKPREEASDVGDDLDQASNERDREFNLIMRQRHLRRLQQIQEAYDRMRDGSYGLCEGTDEPINPRRLMIMPLARYSLEYQEQQEKMLGRTVDTEGESMEGEDSFSAEE